MEIKPTNDTPHIIFKLSGSLIISGRSYPIDTKSFYKDLLRELKYYRKSNRGIDITIDLEHFNTGSSKVILDIFLMFEGTDSKIVWLYDEDDEDMQGAGEDYESMVKLDFEFRTKPVKE